MRKVGHFFSALLVVYAFAILGAANAEALCNQCVDTPDIAHKAVTFGKIAENAVRPRTIAPGAVTAENLATDAVFSRIIVVCANPIDPVGNCDDLNAALAAITDNDADNRYLIKLEPGIYDCGTSSGGSAPPLVEMKRFVDIEGSGETVTRITGNGSGGSQLNIVRGADNSELRHVTVENTDPWSWAIAIGGESLDDFRALHVTALSTAGTFTRAIRVYASTSSVELSYVTAIGTYAGVEVSASGGPFEHLEIYNSFIQSGIVGIANKEVTVRNSVITGGVSSNSSTTIFNLVSTQLVDPVGPNGTFRCVGSYNQDYVALDANCDPP